MLSRKLIMAFSLLIMLLSSSIGGQDPVATEGFKTNAFTTGELNGVKYSYGTNTYTASGNNTQVYNGTIQESTNSSKTTREMVRLIDKINTTHPIDVYYQITLNYRLAIRNETFKVWMNQSKVEEFVTNVTNYLDPVLKANHSSHEAVLVDQYRDYLATFELNSTFFSYTNNDTLYHFPVWGEIIPKYIIFNVTYSSQEVDVTRKTATNAFLAYQNTYSLAYNVSATAHQVNITNGDNFYVGFNMFDNVSANYTEFTASWMGYYFSAVELFNLTYTDGTPVPQDMYPLHMRTRVYVKNGSRVDVGYNRVESKILSTYQNVLSAFVSVDAQADDNSLSIEARLAIWGLSTSTTMIAYNDLNNNDMLDLSLGDGGLKVSNDFPTHVGLAEAYQTNVYTAAYTSHNYTQIAFAWGVNINETIKRPGNFTDNFESYSFGNVNSAIDPVFQWNAPVEDTDGNVVFDFGVKYTNFPVTWVSLLDQSDVVLDNENIAYHYIVKVNPATGKAKISTTWTYDGVNNPLLKASMNGKSLSLLVKSEFFALRALYTATASNDSVNSTTTTTFERIGVRVGNDDATEIDVSGPKQFYTHAGSNNETATFNAIEVVTVAGTFSGERVSPFESESEKTAGTSSKSLTETLDVNWVYQQHLLVVNYPAWDGDTVVHDPDYSVNYQKIEITSPTTSEPTTPTSSQEPTTSTQIVDSTSKTDDNSLRLPGFEGLIVVSSVFITVVVIRRKRN